MKEAEAQNGQERNESQKIHFRQQIHLKKNQHRSYLSFSRVYTKIKSLPGLSVDQHYLAVREK